MFYLCFLDTLYAVKNKTKWGILGSNVYIRPNQSVIQNTTVQQNMLYNNYGVAVIVFHKNSRLTEGGDSLQMSSQMTNPYEGTTWPDAQQKCGM